MVLVEQPHDSLCHRWFSGTNPGKAPLEYFLDPIPPDGTLSISMPSSGSRSKNHHIGFFKLIYTASQIWNSNVPICASERSPETLSIIEIFLASPLLAGTGMLITPLIFGPGCFL
jgi:hypothetical protein